MHSAIKIYSFDAGPTTQSGTKVVRWLEQIKADAAILYLMGDVFDSWFEYKHAVPKGYVRLLGKLAELADSGIEMHYFTGNHDMWAFDYLPKEIGLHLHREPIQKEYNLKKFYLGHGDGLGPGDHGYKFASYLRIGFRTVLSTSPNGD
jgi:UDP-2,3-diacylglucosamine hydrolase